MKKRIFIYLGILVFGLLLIFIFYPPAINYPKNCLGEGVQTFYNKECCYGLKKHYNNNWDPSVIEPAICVPWYK